MSWELLGLILILGLVVLMVIFRKNPLVKKYWKYSLILIPGLIVIVIRLILIWQEKGRGQIDAQKDKTLGNAIQGIASDLKEAQLTSTVEVVAAKQQSADKLKQLEDIKSEPDQDKRISKLADLIG